MPRKKTSLPSDLELIAELRQKVKDQEDSRSADKPDASSQLVSALVEAIKQTKPFEKKTAANYKTRTPYMPADGSPKLKLKRKIHQHGMMVDPDLLYNEDIALLNQLRPGKFMEGHVTVVRRRDKGIDISYPIKTASQRLKLVNSFGIRNFRELIARCIEEANNPVKYAVPEDID